MRNAQYIMFCTDSIIVDLFRQFNYSRKITLPLYYHNRSLILLLQVYLKNKKNTSITTKNNILPGFFKLVIHWSVLRILTRQTLRHHDKVNYQVNNLSK